MYDGTERAVPDGSIVPATVGSYVGPEVYSHSLATTTTTSAASTAALTSLGLDARLWFAVLDFNMLFFAL